MSQRRYISVTSLTRYIKRIIAGDRHLQGIWLRGEISNFNKHSRGHMYMTLKDQNARISAVMFAADNRRLAFVPENGMKVLVHGDVSLYEPYGQYQLYIKEMEQDGIGNLFMAFEALKKKLEAEGLFDPSHKKQLPGLARRIGVITSPTGAAIRDIFSTIKRRFPGAAITVFPVLVQGELAAASIVKAIRYANQLANTDVLIVGRGGGSIEDLWPFNEEIVAREIFLSRLPVISAVGHETDFTIADFVADLRAATPTAAAELVVPNVVDLERRVGEQTERLMAALKRRVNSEKERLAAIDTSYAFRQPTLLIRQKEQDLDRAMERLKATMKWQLRDSWQQAGHNTRLLFKHHPSERMKQAKKEQSDLNHRLVRSVSQLFDRMHVALKQHIGQLNALSPLKVMERGYNLAYNAEGHLIKSVKAVSNQDAIHLRMKDGWMDCQVVGIKEEGDNR
ncbi:exodeoxyribonuclease VII large subunit [Camelliibacillus cellulosilyticus]|uniref:Exodeoxyribonuclease 7 large subunit n=1 Tax=Camelliibacillus cellulosilyticus TaxID=2174486 RepID=A0ABV9GL03_9BACL